MLTKPDDRYTRTLIVSSICSIPKDLLQGALSKQQKCNLEKKVDVPLVLIIMVVCIPTLSMLLRESQSAKNNVFPLWKSKKMGEQGIQNQQLSFPLVTKVQLVFDYHATYVKQLLECPVHNIFMFTQCLCSNGVT